LAGALVAAEVRDSVLTLTDRAGVPFRGVELDPRLRLPIDVLLNALWVYDSSLSSGEDRSESEFGSSLTFGELCMKLRKALNGVDELPFRVEDEDRDCKACAVSRETREVRILEFLCPIRGFQEVRLKCRGLTQG
jgi:hypothetical protein